MSDINKCYFTGRIGKEPELRSTANGTAVCTFSLAVERPKAKGAEKGETDWLDFVAWRSTAEFISRYLGKGRKVVIEATVRTRKFEDKNGNNRKAVEFNVVEIQAADSKPQNGGNSYGGVGQQSSAPAPARSGGYGSTMQSSFAELSDDDDGELPF